RRWCGCDPLLWGRRPGTRGVDALRGALDLPARLPDCFGRLLPQARDSLRRLAALDLGPRAARFLEAAPKRIVHRDADAPRGIVGSECLAERVAEAARPGAGDDAGKSSASKELAAREPVAAVRRF